ncbi:DUF4238 domain-containing protein, partial [Riemerella anatipestifer]|nr:DUF4238 domain-containing protein [Riemerella anatipestifer]
RYLQAFSNIMAKSKRHHFVPQFLMRYFTNEKGKLYVYDKLEDSFFESNTENLFLEKDRNTFKNLEGVDDDIVEKFYTQFDTYFSSILKELNTHKKIDSRITKSLISLAYISKWRVRQYDESFNRAKEYFSVDDLGLGLKNENGERIDIDLESIFDTEMHQELKRILLAIQPIRFKDDFNKIYNNTFFLNTNVPSFISDCPFNEIPLENEVIFEDFIFPIFTDLTLIHSNRVDLKKIQNFIKSGKEENVQNFLNDFSYARDISMLELCERNVACSNLEYLKHIVKNFKTVKQKGMTIPINITVFNVLYHYEEYASR